MGSLLNTFCPIVVIVVHLLANTRCCTVVALPIETPKYYNPYHGDLQNGTPHFEKPQYYIDLSQSQKPTLESALRV